MNQNRPFFSTNTNCYDESFTSSAPTTVNGENVILSQEQQRRVRDTLNTSIVGNPNPFSEAGNQMNQMLYAQKQYYPGGVLFTFPSTSTPSMNFAQQLTQPFVQGLCCPSPPMSMPNTIQNAPMSPPMDFHAFQQPTQFVNTFFPSSLEYQQMNQNALQQPYQYHRDPYQLKFHNDRGTSCSDMLNGGNQVPSSKGLPDFTNINGVIQRIQHDLASLTTCKDMPCTCPIEFSSNGKKMVLSKPVTGPSGHVMDVLDENLNGEKDKPRVSFSDTPVDEEAQVNSECICDAKEGKNKSKVSKTSESGDDSLTEKSKKRKQKRKKKPKKQTKSSSETSVSSDEDDNDSKPQKNTSKKTRWGRQKKIDTTATESSDSEKAGIESKKTRKRKTKKRKNKEKSKDMVEHETQTDSSEFMNDTSEEMDYSVDAEHCKCD